VLLIIISCFTLCSCSSEEEETTLSAEAKYEKAIKLYEDAAFDEAKELFSGMDYKDSSEYVTNCITMKQLQGTWYDEDEFAWRLEITGFAAIHTGFSRDYLIKPEGSMVKFSGKLTNGEDDIFTCKLSYSNSEYTLSATRSNTVYIKGQ